jgi:hypothetical protein
LIPQDILADLDKMWISFVLLSAAYLTCSLNLNLLYIIIYKYFIVFTCSKGLLFKYTLISFVSFRFLLGINITFFSLH